MRKRKLDSYDETGRTEKEVWPVKSFWCDYTMEQVMQMSEKEWEEAIDASLDRYAAERMRLNKTWDWPIPQDWIIGKKKGIDKPAKDIL